MKEYNVYRLIGVSRIPWKIVVDDHDTVIHEGPSEVSEDLNIDKNIENKINVIKAEVEVEQTKAPDNSPVFAPPGSGKVLEDAGRKLLQQRGIKFHEEDGKIIIDELPDRERIIYKFLESEECPQEIPNCEGIRKMFKDEIEDAGGENCKQCDKNRIRNKYREILTRLLDKT